MLINPGFPLTIKSKEAALKFKAASFNNSLQKIN
jgi:hypothetical protein